MAPKWGAPTWIRHLAVQISHDTVTPPHTEPKWPTRWSAVNLPNWLLHWYLEDLLVLLLLEVVVEVEVVE